MEKAHVNGDRKYWFVIEPYVYLSLKNNIIFLYNTLDGAYLKSSDTKIIHFFESQVTDYKSPNLLSGSQLKDKKLFDFISELRQRFMADIIETTLTNGSPLQFTPILNIQNSKNRFISDPNRTIGENLLIHLHEVSFFLKDISHFSNKCYPISSTEVDPYTTYPKYSLDLRLIQLFLEQIKIKEDLTVNIIIKNPSEYKEWSNLIAYLNKLPFKKRYIIHIDNLYINNDFDTVIDDRSIVNYVIDLSNPCTLVKLSSIKNINNKNEYSFLAYREDDIIQIEHFIDKYKDTKYHVIPIYNNLNIDFFRENVYLTEDDILESPISMKQIFINQSINIESFGRLSVVPNGDVYSNIFHKAIGNVKKDTILGIINYEMNHGTSWLSVRDDFPCNECHFQWLCPTPSIYELILKKINLCDIKKS
ncbi:MAG: TIGR04150 pseudo-rSAM protein [Dysgonomonas mossii]|uniref:TIGR04150 pseudo-rSAM protein n=1 Tax=Dysgonomonas mossii TaxID=163665 RepID=UPI0026ED77BE|nr:TIGR04150 pseudo-rSAM protein [Dysgonomonas mossii]MBS5908304.1 TIGR04150 pseudo-rSAM protein [Dysgonomonas mossii]